MPHFLLPASLSEPAQQLLPHLIFHSLRFSSTTFSTMSYRPSNISFTRSAPQYRAASIYGGAGGTGSRVSAASSLRASGPMISSSSSFKLSSGMGSGMGAGTGAGFGGGAAASGSGGHIMGNEKGAMQNLNDRLASYLETVRNLESANKELEMKIRQALEKGGPDMRDFSKYEPIIEDLRKQVNIQ